MTMVADRNRSSHAYDQDAAREIITRVIEQHYSAFEKMRKRFSELAEKGEDA